MSNKGTEITLEDRWVVAKEYLKMVGLANQQIRSFNDFVEKNMQEIVNAEKVIELNNGFKIELGKIRLGNRPVVLETDATMNEEITPLECRIRDLTYAVPIFLEVKLYGPNNELIDSGEFKIGDLPVMLRSVLDPLSKMTPDEIAKMGEDPTDPGGYFIVNGSERVLVIQEDLASNKVLVDRGGPQSTITHTAKVASAALGYRQQLIVERQKDGTLHAVVPSVPGKVPFVILMRALGVESDRDIVLTVSLDPEIQQELLPSLEMVSNVLTTEEALDFIGARVAVNQPREVRIKRAEEIIDKQVLPHLGTTPEARRKKAILVGYMAAKLLELHLNKRNPDDKDHYANKRVRLAGDLMTMLFRNVLRQALRDLRYQLERMTSKDRRRLKLRTLIRPDLVTEKIRHALSTGNWPGGRTGVSQLLDRTNWISTVSHLRRVVSPLSRTQTHFEARDLHMTQWGRICPFETPEGPNIGLVKNLALSAYISRGVNEKDVEKKLYELGVVPIERIIEMVKEGEPVPQELVEGAKVLLNGNLVGYHPDGKRLAQELRKLRRRGEIHYEVSVAYIEEGEVREVYINTDAGRIMRPLIVVEDGEIKLKKEHIKKIKSGEWTIEDLLKRGIIELLDADEEENAYIALEPEQVTNEHTHVELWTPAIFGVAASTIPYIEHNQSPRNSYQSAMVKQALGLYAYNFNLRVDTRAHLLHYPERPLVQTRALDVIGYNQHPAGQNMVVAILSYTGYNIEDAIIMNKSSVERGLVRSTFFRLYSTEEKKYPGGQEDRIEIPDPTKFKIRGYRGQEAYKKLGPDGIIEPETEVKGGEVLVGKTSPPRFMDEVSEFGIVEARRRDTSVAVRHGESGVVDTVIITQNRDGLRTVKVKVRDLRIPEIGDKFASRHGQKGVIGMLLPQYDMPYTEHGVVPDIILNPHAFPSRMTLGQLIESIAAKAAALRGKEVDATPFYKEPIERLREVLRKYGFPIDGTEVMFDGKTGEMIRRPAFIGIVYYQRLHHMVADKIHARARGPVQILTRQPTEGRAREGGLRFGEMERDCLVAHGTAYLLQERLLKSSDATKVWVCAKCGYIGWFDAEKGVPVCPIHGTEGEMYLVEMSYAFKLLLQELMSMCISPRLILGEKFEKLPEESKRE